MIKARRNGYSTNYKFKRIFSINSSKRLAESEKQYKVQTQKPAKIYQIFLQTLPPYQSIFSTHLASPPTHSPFHPANKAPSLSLLSIGLRFLFDMNSHRVTPMDSETQKNKSEFSQ